MTLDHSGTPNGRGRVCTYCVARLQQVYTKNEDDKLVVIHGMVEIMSSCVVKRLCIDSNFSMGSDCLRTSWMESQFCKAVSRRSNREFEIALKTGGVVNTLIQLTLHGSLTKRT